MVNKYELTQIIEEIAPPETAESWDLSGWIVETPRTEVSKVMLCLTVTEDILRQAEANGCDMIISHHPLFFVPLDFNCGIENSMSLGFYRLVLEKSRNFKTE